MCDYDIAGNEVSPTQEGQRSKRNHVRFIIVMMLMLLSGVACGAPRALPAVFWTLGAVSPLEETAFHLLPLRQRVGLLKGLCDHVYETQKEVQHAVLAQPIHECRESILGYDAQDNAYIHFPHFCGADLRIYSQSPCGAVQLPLPLIQVTRCHEPEGQRSRTTHVSWVWHYKDLFTVYFILIFLFSYHLLLIIFFIYISFIDYTSHIIN